MPWLHVDFGKPSTVLCKPWLCTLIEDARLAQRSSLRPRAPWEFCSQTQLPRPSTRWDRCAGRGGEDGKMQRAVGGSALPGHPVGQSFNPAPGTV